MYFAYTLCSSLNTYLCMSATCMSETQRHYSLAIAAWFCILRREAVSAIFAQPEVVFLPSALEIAETRVTSHATEKEKFRHED